MIAPRTLTAVIVIGWVVGVIALVILNLGLLAQDASAYTGFCLDSDGFLSADGCCSEDTDCSEGSSCMQEKGVCSEVFSYPGSPCQTDSECGTWCAPIGECVGGEYDGSPCFASFGACLSFFNITPCRTDNDCPELPGCLPWGALWVQCGGATCVSCTEGCSIATVSLGTELQERIDVLHSFRDKYLQNNALGKSFISAYYKYSPPVAHFIAEREWLKAAVRILLLPVIGLVSLFV